MGAAVGRPAHPVAEGEDSHAHRIGEAAAHFASRLRLPFMHNARW